MHAVQHKYVLYSKYVKYVKYSMISHSPLLEQVGYQKLWILFLKLQTQMFHKGIARNWRLDASNPLVYDRNAKVS